MQSSTGWFRWHPSIQWLTQAIRSWLLNHVCLECSLYHKWCPFQYLLHRMQCSEHAPCGISRTEDFRLQAPICIGSTKISVGRWTRKETLSFLVGTEKWVNKVYTTTIDSSMKKFYHHMTLSWQSYHSLPGPRRSWSWVEMLFLIYGNKILQYSCTNQVAIFKVSIKKAEKQILGLRFELLRSEVPDFSPSAKAL